MDARCQIRHADVDDLAALCAIERAAFRDAWSRAQLAACLADPALFLVAHREGTILGYVILHVVADEAELLNLAVDPVARGQGVGRALIRAGVTAAGARGARAVYLEVRESNAVARHLYATEGFEVVGRRAGYYRTPAEDAVVLRAAILAGEGDA